jgi:beta-glucosidase
MAGGPFLLEKADGSLVDGWTDVAEEGRATWLTLEEKVLQMQSTAPAIPRLGVPAYNWWNEALHGVMQGRATVFPQAIGLGATWDTALMRRVADAISTEARAKYNDAQTRPAPSGPDALAILPGRTAGLTYWSPNINIFRDPRWGRGQETYGEDPFLSGRLAVAFVTGMQGDDPRYYRVISTPKHFAVHSGPEPTRHFADVDVSKHDELDTYTPAFRAAVVEGHAGSIMCAYNAINGQPACANEFLLQHTLRGAWHFQGYVVSDCDAVRNIFRDHKYRPTQPQASAISLLRGMDNECIDGPGKVTDDHDYKPYVEAVQQGYLPESAVDTALIRLFTARIRLGMFERARDITEHVGRLYSHLDDELEPAFLHILEELSFD